MDKSAECEHQPFSEGRFRYAYKGKWKSHPTKLNQNCVVKKFKDTYIWKPSGWDTTVTMYSKARELSKIFGNRNIDYTSCDVLTCTSSSGIGRCVKLNEMVVAEDYLEGHFIKWCNNYGYVSQEARGTDHILPAFMHWSWVHSKGQEMIGDIQGVKKPGGGYKLTDPAMMSITNQYGVTDTGVEGMAMFFRTHKCTPACSSLPKPTLDNFAGNIPEHMLQSALQLQDITKQGTNYTHEMKFTEGVRRTVAATFTAIAQGQVQKFSKSVHTMLMF